MPKTIRFDGPEIQEAKWKIIRAQYHRDMLYIARLLATMRGAVPESPDYKEEVP